MKLCSTCNEIKPIGEYSKNKTRKDGYQHRCKKCISEHSLIFEVKENRSKYMKRYRSIPKNIKRRREYISTIEYKEKACIYDHKRRSTPEGKKKKSEYDYKYRLKPEIKEAIRRYNCERRKNPVYRLNHNICNSISYSLKRNKDGCHWESLVDYTLQELVKHIEKQFKPGMSWDNYGEWHLDHVIPKIHFNFTSYKDLDFKRCWALRNLQPLWAKDNLSKYIKLDAPFQPALKLQYT